MAVGWNEKRCSACGEVKKLTEFHRYTGATARSADGFRAVCIECRRAAERAKYQKSKEARRG